MGIPKKANAKGPRQRPPCTSALCTAQVPFERVLVKQQQQGGITPPSLYDSVLLGLHLCLRGLFLRGGLGLHALLLGGDADALDLPLQRAFLRRLPPLVRGERLLDARGE